MIDPLLTRRTVADALNISIATVDRMIHKGQINIVTIGPRSIRITPEEVQRLISNGKGANMTPHATLPECPYCTAKAKVILDLNGYDFHCFNCNRSGILRLTLTTSDDAAETRTLP